MTSFRHKLSQRPKLLRTGSALAASALICLPLASTIAPAAHAQSHSGSARLQGTVCEAPDDDNTKSACAIALVHCTMVSAMYGRTEEERDRMLRVCVQKTASQAKRGIDAQGDAVRRAYGGETDAEVAADRAEKKRAAEKADAAAAAAQAHQTKVFQDKMDAIKQACTTGQGTLVVNSGPAQIEGPHLSPLDGWAYRNQIMQPIADPVAPVQGKCMVQFTRGKRTITGKVSILSVAPN